MAELNLTGEGSKVVSVVDFRRPNGPRPVRLSDLTQAQIEKLLQLLAMMDDLTALLAKADKLFTGCPVARNILGD